MTTRARCAHLGLCDQRDPRCVAYDPWWISPEPGSVLSGPYTEDEARAQWEAGEICWPDQQAWRGPDPARPRPARAAWLPRTPEQQEVAGLSDAELAASLGQLPAVTAAYRDAVLAEAATRLMNRSQR
jgi:hypothetical protein